MAISSYPSLPSNYSAPRRPQLREGRGKILYDGPEPGTHVLFFKDEGGAGNSSLTLSGKGVLNNRISELLMTRLNDMGINTHFIRRLNMREQLIRATEVLPFNLTIHNLASGSFALRLGLEEGMSLPKPIPEFALRSRELNNPVVAVEHLAALGWGRLEEIDDILLISQRVNDFLSGQFLALNMRLISFTLEFGRYYVSDFTEPHILVIDELSPDTCNLLDLTTGERLDQQGVQNQPHMARNIYQTVASRFGLLDLEAFKEKPIAASDRIFPKNIIFQTIVKKKI